MKTCPECGDDVPFGGGRSVENAHAMFGLVRNLRGQLESGEEGAAARQFCDRGRTLAEALHDYGHKRTMVNPDWAAAGLWKRQAIALARNIGIA